MRSHDGIIEMRKENPFRGRMDVYFDRKAQTLGCPWVIRGQKWVKWASHVVIRDCRVESCERPVRENGRPRFFIRLNGVLRFRGTVAYISKIKGPSSAS